MYSSVPALEMIQIIYGLLKPGGRAYLREISSQDTRFVVNVFLLRSWIVHNDFGIAFNPYRDLEGNFIGEVYIEKGDQPEFNPPFETCYYHTEEPYERVVAVARPVVETE